MFLDWFELAMKREVKRPRTLIDKRERIELGCGNNPLPFCTRHFELPEWEAPRIPMLEESCSEVWAHHFFEHLSSDVCIATLRECERVLCPSGSLFIVVPHRLGSMAFHDLDHRTFWCEDTLKTLFSTPYYDKGREQPWKLAVRFTMIAGLVERNLAVFFQVEKLA